MPEIITIPTEHPDVELRTRSAADDQAYLDALLASRGELVGFSPRMVTRLNTVEDVARDREAWPGSDTTQFGLFHEDIYVAYLSLTTLSPRDAEITYWTHASHRRKGYASLGARALSDYALTTYHTITANVRPLNVASQGVLRKAGFEQRGESPTWLYFKRYRAIDRLSQPNDPRNERAFY